MEWVIMMAEQPTKTKPDTAKLALVTKALADPSRIRILRLLTRDTGESCGDGICICDLVAETGLIQSLVSYHMKILREAGLVHEQPRGKWKYYRVNTDTVNAFLAAWSAILLGSK